jgi:cardiolipin synthase A/B
MSAPNRQLTRGRRGGADRRSEIQRDRAWICVPNLHEGRGTFRLFVEGDPLYDAMLTAIERAEQDIRLESYIFAADEVGRRFVAALVAKARSGLDVRVHLDSFGSGFRGFRSLQGQLETAGVQLRWFRPFRSYRPLQYFQRNHRKLLVVDGREAFLGGFNIRRLNSRTLHGDMRQRDTHVSVAGELATLAAASFDRLWNQERQPRPEAIPEDATGLEALLVPSYSRRCQHRLACLHAGLIANARRHVYLTSAYFSPGRMVDVALRATARRGVDVRLLVPRQGDPPAAGWATRAAYEQLLQVGVRIFEYGPRKLHAKTSVIDAQWSVVGSANLDYLSLFVNQELVLVARDRTLAEGLLMQYQHDLGESAEVLLAEWRRRGWRERALETVGRSVRRFL